MSFFETQCTLQLSDAVVRLLMVLCCVLQGGNVALMASDSQSVLGRAFLKYADALTLDDVNAAYQFHVGRLLVAQGDYSSAIARLETALSWNAKHQLARFITQCLSTQMHLTLSTVFQETT